MQREVLDVNTPAWRMQVWLNFAVAFGATLTGCWFLPVDLWTKGFMVMGVLFTVGSSFTLAKTLRDDHEAQKLNRRVDNARTEKLIQEYGD